MENFKDYRKRRFEEEAKNDREAFITATNNNNKLQSYFDSIIFPCFKEMCTDNLIHKFEIKYKNEIVEQCLMHQIEIYIDEDYINEEEGEYQEAEKYTLTIKMYEILMNRTGKIIMELEAYHSLAGVDVTDNYYDHTVKDFKSLMDYLFKDMVDHEIRLNSKL